MESSDGTLPLPESTVKLLEDNEVSSADGFSVHDLIDVYDSTADAFQEPSQSEPPQTTYGTRNISDLLEDLVTGLKKTEQFKDKGPDEFTTEYNKHLYALNMNRLKPTLYNVLAAHKERTAQFMQQMALMGLNQQDTQADSQKLDTMLIAEGVADPPLNYSGQIPNSSVDSEQSEYVAKIAGLKSIYNEYIKGLERKTETIKGDVVKVLQSQSTTRPISQRDVQFTLGTIERKLKNVQLQIKQHACESVLNYRSKLMDARRKRRNFSKNATEILNNWFHTHLSNPYPSEEAKEELAKQCDISVSQVSNWFGNKRIRYKKNLGKTQLDASNHGSKRASQSSAPYPVMTNRSLESLSPPIPSPAPSASSQGGDFQTFFGVNFSMYPGFPFQPVSTPGYDQLNPWNFNPNASLNFNPQLNLNQQ